MGMIINRKSEYYVRNLFKLSLPAVNKKILRFLKISSDFQNVFLSKYYEKIYRNLSSKQHQNILSGNFSDFLKKLVGAKFSDFCLKIYQNSDFC